MKNKKIKKLSRHKCAPLARRDSAADSMLSFCTRKGERDIYRMNAVVVTLPEEFLFHGSECFTTRQVISIEDIFSLERIQ